MRSVLIGSLLLAVMVGAMPAAAQNRVQDDPGYVNFLELDDALGSDPTIEVNIQGALLRLVAEASEFEDPELARLLRKVRGVYVRGFELRGLDVDEVRRQKDLLSDELERKQWDSVINVRDRMESVSFYVRLLDDEIAGLVVMSVDLIQDQAVFLNIVGNIDPEEIGRIGRKFGLDGVSDK